MKEKDTMNEKNSEVKDTENMPEHAAEKAGKKSNVRRRGRRRAEKEEREKNKKDSAEKGAPAKEDVTDTAEESKRAEKSKKAEEIKETEKLQEDGAPSSDKARKKKHSDEKKKGRKGKKGRKKKGLRKWMKKHKAASAIIILFLIVILTVAGLFGSIVWSLNHNSIGIVDPEDVDPTAREVKIAREDQKNEDVVNILLVGSDARDPNAEMGRSDTMMLVSFNKAEGKATVVSFLRDTLIDIEGYGKSKLGHTFAYGGVGLTINTLNKQFDLDIQDYIIINFDNLVEIIDELGGIQVNLTEEEAEYYRKTGMPDIQSGWVTLTGSQALAHARNRSLDNDFGRTGRQRSVLYGIYNKVMQNKDPADILSLIKFCMSQVSTNMGVTELYSIATDVMSVEHLKTQQAAVPQDGTYEFDTYDSMSVLTIDLEANKEYIKGLLY